MIEIWKDIKDYEGLYKISNLGRVKRLEGSYLIGKWAVKTSIICIKEKILKTQLYKHGYTYVTLCKDGSAKKMKVHRLLGIYFIPNPNNYPFLNHINGIRNDNRIENLEWCTHSHNMKHKFILGNQSNAGRNNAMAKKVRDTSTGEVYGCITEAAKVFKIHRSDLGKKIKAKTINLEFV